MSNATYDFIIVGAGPCGSSLAHRLSRAAQAPRILLLEGGGTNEDPSTRVAGERTTFWAKDGVALDKNYKTCPQPALENRELPYHRGRGLGGSTAINIGVWDYGAAPEYNNWAEMVGDESWNWENTKRRMREIETYHNLTPAEYNRYVGNLESHGTSGPVDVTYPSIWDPCLPVVFDAINAHGLPMNKDLSSEVCIGMGVAPSTVHGCNRVTASTAYLKNKSDNLDVKIGDDVQRILFQGQKAIGVQLSSGTQYFAKRDIILCAGAIDTPKLLLLSGVGDETHLKANGIPVVLHQPSVGQNLQDHPVLRLGASIKPNSLNVHPMPASSDDIAAAVQGYVKLPTSLLPALSTLSQNTQTYLQDSRVPTHELLLRVIPANDQLIWLAVLVFMNCQSTGRVSLRSANASDPPVIDLNLLSHTYDLELIREGIRDTVPILRESSVIETENLSLGPATLDDIAIDEYVRKNLSHLWHASGSVKMGNSTDKTACISSDFRFVGLDGLRVADLSIVPLLPSHHIQSTAYLIGNNAADKIIAEYSLDN